MNADEPLPPPHTDADQAEDDSVEGLRARLAERDARLREVSALVAHTRHELSNLLTGMLGQSQLLLMREELTPTARRRVEAIEELARRMRDATVRLNDI